MKRIEIVIAGAWLLVGCDQGGQPAPPATAAASPASAASARVSQAVSPATEKPATETLEVQKPVETPAAPPAEKPAPEAPAVPAPTRERIRLIIPNGTLLPLEIRTTVSTDHSHEGDPVLAVLSEDVPLKGFKLDKGAEVRGKVLVAVSGKGVKGGAHLVVRFDAVMKSGERLVVATESIDSMAASASGKDKTMTTKGGEVELARGARATVTVAK